MHPALPPVFRFAPSPNGALHLGHARSALLNFDMARKMGAKFLLRLEDIDTTRCTPELESQMLRDLAWLGLEWDEPPRRQSEHFDDYRTALKTLDDAGLIYPAFLSRSEIRNATSHENWPRDPDGAPHYPGDERHWSKTKQQAQMKARPRHAWRLNMAQALKDVPGILSWQETGQGPDGETGQIVARPERWGDVVLARSDVPTSYHLSVVVDDARSGITHVVRGADLFHATSVHRLLQHLLGLPQPIYHHHDLVPGEDGRKLSKSNRDTSLAQLRAQGLSPRDIRHMVMPDAAWPDQ